MLLKLKQLFPTKQKRGACSPDSLYFLPSGVRFAFSPNPVPLPGPSPEGLDSPEFCMVCAWVCLWYKTCRGPGRLDFNPQLGLGISFSLRAAGLSELGEWWQISSVIHFSPLLHNLWMSLSHIFPPESKLIIVTIITHHLEFSIPDELGWDSRIWLLPVTMDRDFIYIYMYCKSFTGRSIMCLLPDKNPVDFYAYELWKSLISTYKIRSIFTDNTHFTGNNRTRRHSWRRFLGGQASTPS